jgi:predicted glycogen debranching enzyme
MSHVDYMRALRMTVKPSELGIERGKRLEWVLPNGLGGYASSTVLGLNTRKYHGLLVSSDANLDRRVMLGSFVEEVQIGDSVTYLSLTEYKDAFDSKPVNHLKKFTRARDHVKFEYDVNGTTIVKIVHMAYGVNGAVFSYGMRNNSGGVATLRVRPLVNARGMHEINPQGRDMRASLPDAQTLTAGCRGDTLVMQSDDMRPFIDEEWYKNVHYCLEAERGEGSDEDIYSPGAFELRVASFSTRDAELKAVVALEGQDPATLMPTITETQYRLFEPDPLQILEAAADSFLIQVHGYASVIAGYHWFGEWGRDTMISLPGLTMVNGRFDACESILARFIDSMRDGRIPTKFEVTGPTYYDFDGTLWMIDRLKEYMRFAGADRAGEFIAPRWGKIKSVILNYSKLLDGGLLKHKAGTWMDTMERNDAVEVQALWYNALNVVESLSELMGDPQDLQRFKSDFESSFMDKYWNGNYLNDCLGDESLRPNQVIAVGLTYSAVPDRESAQLMSVVEEELLTPCGLRTLNRENPHYAPRYEGGIDERTKAYHNGTVWPWLLGPYANATVRLGGEKGKKYAIEALKPVISRLYDNCIGTVAEVYDADEPHTGRGAVSQAWSVAEIMRSYQEFAPKKRD